MCLHRACPGNVWAHMPWVPRSRTLFGPAACACLGEPTLGPLSGSRHAERMNSLVPLAWPPDPSNLKNLWIHAATSTQRDVALFPVLMAYVYRCRRRYSVSSIQVSPAKIHTYSTTGLNSWCLIKRRRSRTLRELIDESGA